MRLCLHCAEVHAYVRGRKEEGEGAASETTASRTTAIVAFGDQPLSGTKEGAPINYFIGWKKRRPDSPEVGPEQGALSLFKIWQRANREKHRQRKSQRGNRQITGMCSS